MYLLNVHCPYLNLATREKLEGKIEFATIQDVIIVGKYWSFIKSQDSYRIVFAQSCRNSCYKEYILFLCAFETPILICDYYDSMITQISNIDLSSQPSRHFAHALARNNIVPPSDRQIKFVDAQRFDLPLLQNRRWIRFLPLACLCYIVQVCSDKRVTGDGMAEKTERPGKTFFPRADDTNIAPKERFDLMSLIAK